MDVERVRTFLEIVHTGSFLRAAERLNVTQTTVSARIRTLEDELGRTLFIRNRNGARLTPAGIEFERFAQVFVGVWEQARQQLAVPQGKSGVVNIAAEYSLWNPILVDWMVGLRSRPELAVRAQVGEPDKLVEELRTGALDVALLYAPRLLPGLEVELLIEENLVFVRRAGDGSAGAGHVFVDWGSITAPAAPLAGEPDVSVGFGPLGLAYIVKAGGSGYFRRKLVVPYIEAGTLERVEGMPAFPYPAYAVYARDARQRPEVDAALAILEHSVRMDPQEYLIAALGSGSRA